MSWNDRYGDDDRLDLAGLIGAVCLFVFVLGTLAGLVYVVRAL